LSFRRKPESMVWTNRWIPAYAGMTIEVKVVKPLFMFSQTH